MADLDEDRDKFEQRANSSIDLNKKIVSYTRMFKLDPNVFAVYTQWAVQLLKCGQHKKAKQKFKRAIQMCQNPSSIYDDWQFTLYSAREFEEAILFGEKYLDKFIFPDNTQNTLGACFFHLGDYENAIKCFQNAAQKEGLGVYYFNWALALYLQGKKEEALEMYGKAKKMDGFPEALYEREVSDLKEDLKKEENKMFEEFIKKKIEAFEYFLEMDRKKQRH